MTQPRPLPAASRRFVDDLAALLAPWGMSGAVGRLYAYLLQAEAPVSLDDIVAHLGLAKSSASVAARLLERHGLARSRGVPGSKRVLYEATALFTDLLRAQSALYGEIGGLLRGHTTATADAATRTRLRRLAGLATEMGESMQEVIARYAEPGSPRDGRAAPGGAELPNGAGG